MTQMTDGFHFVIPAMHGWTAAQTRANAVTMDAANEAIHSVGHIYNPDGSSHTISAAGGGSIFWYAGSAITLSKATTNLRIGVQDVSLTAAPLRGDGTFDVYADLGSSDGVTANTFFDTPMESGTKTIADGDMISISHTLTARGSGDSITVAAVDSMFGNGNVDMQFPLMSTYTGSWGRSTVGQAHAGIKYDDGSYGFLTGSLVPKTITTVAFNSGSTPDEIGNVITMHQTMSARGAIAVLSLSSTTSPQPSFELCLYSDPLGTPSLIEAISVTVDALQRSASKPIFIPFTTTRTLSSGSTYGITIRPTTSTSVTCHYWSVNAANELDASYPDDNCYAISRSDNTGAFTEYSPSDTANCVRVSVHLKVQSLNTTTGPQTYDETLSVALSESIAVTTGTTANASIAAGVTGAISVTGGLTISASSPIDVTTSATATSDITVGAQSSIALQKAIASTAAAAVAESNTLGISATTTPTAAASIIDSATLGVSESIAATGGLLVASSVSLAKSLGLAEATTAAINESTTLAQSDGVSVQAALSVAETVTANLLSAIDPAASASINDSATLSAISDITTAGGLLVASATTLAAVMSLAESETATISGTAALTVQNNVTSAPVIAASDSVTAAITVSIAPVASANIVDGSTLASVLDITTGGGLLVAETLSAALALSESVAELVTIGLSTSLGITQSVGVTESANVSGAVVVAVIDGITPTATAAINDSSALGAIVDVAMAGGLAVGVSVPIGSNLSISAYSSQIFQESAAIGATLAAATSGAVVIPFSTSINVTQAVSASSTLTIGAEASVALSMAASVAETAMIGLGVPIGTVMDVSIIGDVWGIFTADAPPFNRRAVVAINLRTLQVMPTDQSIGGTSTTITIPGDENV